MSKPIVSFDEQAAKDELRKLVGETIEETIDDMLDEEADQLVGAAPYERTDERAAYRAGHYGRGFTTTSGRVTLKMPKLKDMRFAAAVVKRYKRRETSVEEVIIEMRLAGVSTRRIEDGYREAIGCAEGFTESTERWRDFLSWLKSRGLRGVRMFAGDKAAGMVGSIAEVFPDAKYQRCTVHFYRNALAKVPKSKRSQARPCSRPSTRWSRAKRRPPRSCVTATPRPSRTVRCPASIGAASARTTRSSGTTGR